MIITRFGSPVTFTEIQTNPNTQEIKVKAQRDDGTMVGGDGGAFIPLIEFKADGGLNELLAAATLLMQGDGE